MGLYQTPLLIASLLLCIGSPSGVGAKHSCPPSYCGNLQIRYPFRLKGDKPTCGDRRYELTCDGNNRTIIDINSGKYYVKSISYSKSEEHIEIIDVRLASGGCALPSNTFSTETISRDVRFTLSVSLLDIELTVASFVNCTKEIQRLHYPYPYPFGGDFCPSRSNNFINCSSNRNGRPYYMYSHVPCLSGSNASVYVIFSTIVGDIPPTCRFLGTVATYKGYREMDEDVLKDLQNGFSLNWAYPSCDPVPLVVKYCSLEANYS